MDRTSRMELTNLCMVYDGDKILVEEKVGSNDRGIFFPGGHVEPGESCTDAVIREVYEETGLTIRNPKLCGLKDWIEEDGSRYLVLMYKADQYTGTIRSSEEGKVFWVDIKDLDQMNTIWNMKELLQILTGDQYGEFFFKIENDTWEGVLL